MITDSKIIELFCLLDGFSKQYDTLISKNSHPEPNGKRRCNRKSKMSDGEVMAILVLFHLKSYRNLKHFYINHVCKFMCDEFPECVFYNRFVELQKKVVQPLGVFMKMHCLGNCTGISFIDSTTLKSCHYKREKQHKVFAGLAKKSFGTLGWFYGFN